MTTSLRQVYAFIRAWRDRQKDKWQHTLLLYCQTHNMNLSKKDQSKRLDPNKMLADMFDRKSKKIDDQQMIQKLFALVAATGGADKRVTKQ